MNKLKVGVIGAGPSGLCACRHALAYNCEVTVFEQTSKLGGTWVYTDQVGNDEYGLPIHTSMYNGLKTNGPVESMCYPDFPYPKKELSFAPRDEALDFFQSYANNFKVKEVIKFLYHVVRVRPVQESRWEVLVKNLSENSYETQIFDAIFICNGHYNEPYYPDLKGRKLFKGKQIHSHDYRRPDLFRDENVLIIGAGPSGRDILFEIAKTAKRITLSHHRDLTKITFPSNVTQKGDVRHLTENSAVFMDDTEESFTMILFCTGYKFSFPFLSVDSGIFVDDYFCVRPLYKHCLNANHPTMAIIGLQICAYTLMYDLQVRLCLKYWTNALEMPSKDDMLKDTDIQMKKQWDKGNSKREAHLLGPDQNEYFTEITALAKVDPIPEVLLKIYDDCTARRISNPNDYREFNYTIIDDKTFTVSKIGDDKKNSQAEDKI